tara:strand:- start:11125 stop:11529 length:405 start_codon:yes stop_codon:yes gene_type:complete
MLDFPTHISEVDFEWLEVTQPSEHELSEACDFIRYADADEEPHPQLQEAKEIIIAHIISQFVIAGTEAWTEEDLNDKMAYLIGSRTTESMAKDGMLDVMWDDMGNHYTRTARSHTGYGKYKQEYYASVKRNSPT